MRKIGEVEMAFLYLLGLLRRTLQMKRLPFYLAKRPSLPGHLTASPCGASSSTVSSPKEE